MSRPPSPDAVRDDYAALPAEAQQTVADFVAFLSRQTSMPTKRRSTHSVPFREDPFVGMWKDRPEMEDSVEYIRQLRRREFREPNG